MDLIELEILKMEHSVSYNNTYAVILFEKGGNRSLPIIIGSYEARSIAIGIEEMDTPRPLTHDLIINTFEELNIELQYVHIHKIVEGIFYSNLICKNKKTGEIHAIDSRTSDAIAVAVRAKSKIYTSENLLEEAGLEYHGEYDDTEEELIELDKQSKALDEIPVSKLKEMMQEMLDKEDYEEAARIRDAIKRKQS